MIEDKQKVYKNGVTDDKLTTTETTSYYQPQLKKRSEEEKDSHGRITQQKQNTTYTNQNQILTKFSKNLTKKLVKQDMLPTTLRLMFTILSEIVDYYKLNKEHGDSACMRRK
jgi:hypothetical protein